jgi:hypothetical protein
MNYELAKELYDAGFHQGGKGTWILPTNSIVARRADRVYVPTLSELIEACPHTLHGRGVFALTSANAGELWEADYISFYPPKITVDKEYHGQGPTPEEAVALLWLALNKQV